MKALCNLKKNNGLNHLLLNAQSSLEKKKGGGGLTNPLLNK